MGRERLRRTVKSKTQKEKSERKSRRKQERGAKGEVTKAVHTQNPDLTTPLQQTQITSNPVKMSQAPRLPRTCYCESQKRFTHSDIKDVFFH